MFTIIAVIVASSFSVQLPFSDIDETKTICHIHFKFSVKFNHVKISMEITPNMEKMRAMVLSECAPIETSPLKLTQIDKHKISRPNEILIKIEACGVCHSQLHGIEGDWKDY